MKRKTGFSFEADCTALAAQVDQGKAQPATVPTELPLASIRRWPMVFQHRTFLGYASESHIRTLATAIKKSKSKSLDPILVWWDGKDWTCVDGHHRHAAYTLAEVGSEHPVPVEVFQGTLGQAMGAAASANTRNKLAMSSVEKSNAAWRIVAMTDMSKSEAASAAGVSESTVANMRKVFNQLEAKVNAALDELSISPHGNFRDLNWEQAKRLAEGRDEVDFDREEANEKKASDMALALRKAIGKEGWKQPEILARALELYDGRLPEQLADFWGNQDGSEEDELETDEC